MEILKPPLISIVVISTCAANLKTNLQAVVEAAKAIESAEIILVCQGYCPDQLFARTGLTIKILYSPKLMGISRARNAGADHSHGRYISFLDDDIRPDRNFYKLMLTTMQIHPEYVAVLGSLQVRDNQNSSLFRKFKRSGKSKLRQYDLWRLANGNTGVFVRTGLRFDPRLGVGTNFGSFEDADYLIAYARLGILAYLPEAILLHPDMTEAETRDARRVCQYGRGLGGCLRKNGGFSGAMFFVASLLYNLLMLFRFRPYVARSSRWTHIKAIQAKFIGWFQWPEVSKAYTVHNEKIEIIDPEDVPASMQALGVGL